MKKLLLGMSLFLTMATLNSATVTNNGNSAVNIVFYSSSYVAPDLNKKISGKGRLTAQGTLITGGQNIQIPAGAANMGIYAGNGTQEVIHQVIASNASYTLYPGPTWTVTVD